MNPVYDALMRIKRRVAPEDYERVTGLLADKDKRIADLETRLIGAKKQIDELHSALDEH